MVSDDVKYHFVRENASRAAGLTAVWGFVRVDSMSGLLFGSSLILIGFFSS